MEGVEILNQFEAVTESAFNMQAFWITVGIITLIGGIIGIIMALYEDDWTILIVSIVCSVICGLVIGVVTAGLLDPVPQKYETRYQVIITDEVKMTEFNEQYEILDQEGKIYTVREKSK